MRTYILTSANLFDFEAWRQKEVIICEDKFLSKERLKSRTKIKKLDYSSCWVAPGKVYVDVEKPIFNSKIAESQVKTYLNRGCTLLLVQFPVKSLMNLKSDLAHFKKSLEALPIDYSVVPRIKAHLLKPSVIHYFARERLPFILLEIENVTDIYKVKWQWIKQAQGNRNIPIIPIENGKITILEKEWNKIVKSFDLVTLPELISNLPLSKESLRLTGISPTKGEIIQHGDADYLLFPIEKYSMIEQPNQLFYHKSIPSITVLRGEKVKEDHLLKIENGFGKFIPTTIPYHFSV